MEVEDWNAILSGGQKQKVAIASMIIKKPNFILMDETFAGLDKKSVIATPRIIKRELSESMVFIVDHHHEKNNYNSFYDKELHLENKRLTVREIKPHSSDI